jgi:hypothetical protein
MMQKDNIDAVRVAAVGFFGAFIVFLAVLALQVLFHWQDRREGEKKAGSPVEYPVLAAKQAALLGQYGWVDKAAGTVRIPIERAMELVLAERGGTGKQNK